MSVKIGRNDPCWCKSGRKYKACHQAFDEKIAAIAAQGHIVPTHDIIKNADQIAGIKESCKINIAVLDYIQEHIHEGMNTAEIDKIVYDMTTSMGGIPAPLHYQGYPYSVCTSVNDQVCHGFPSKDVILKSGDIINVDVSTITPSQTVIRLCVRSADTAWDWSSMRSRGSAITASAVRRC